MKYFPYAAGERFSRLRTLVRLFQIQKQIPEQPLNLPSIPRADMAQIPASAAEKAAQSGI